MLLLGFLSFLHGYVVFDWGLSIIVLVLCVRTLLHPLTRKAQISMHRFSRLMGALKPELDKLRSKYGDEPKRMQQEQMRLMREHKLNPFQMLGCLPMFLQMPIWVALYAMLYFAFDLRQEPAFFGIFQEFGGWAFLADLSSADHFFGEFESPRQFLLWNLTGINLLPLLMGVFFFIQQKYMSPPPSAAMSPEQAKQQKMMRVLMVIMFPLMLYSAPSGLTLYILTSSVIGSLEGHHIRKHIDELDVDKPEKVEPVRGQGKDKGKGKKKPRDAQARAYADMLERRKAAKRTEKPRSFKKRK